MTGAVGEKTKRAYLLSAALLALWVGFEFSVRSGAVRLYVLIAACCLWGVFSALKNGRALLKPDWACAFFALFLTFSIRMNFELITFVPGAALALMKKAYPLFFIPWYFLLRSIRLCDWQRLCSIGPQPGRHLSVRQALTLAALLALILALAYIPFYPYGTSGDVYDQAAQIDGTLAYNRVHAIGHTILLKVLLGICGSFTGVVIFQLAAVVALYVAYADYFYYKGLPLWLTGSIQALALTFIHNSTEAFFIPWKDTPAALCLGVAALIFMRYADSGSLSKKAAVGLGLALAWCYLFRLNGLVALIICGGYSCVSLLRRHLLPQLALLVITAAVCIFSVELYADKGLHALDPDNGFSVQVFGSGIAAVVNSGDASPAELEEIDRVLPVEWMRGRNMTGLLWERDGSPRIANDPDLLIFNNEYVLQMGENKREVIALYLKLLPRHFSVCLKDVLENIGMMWKLQESFFISNYVFQFILLALFATRLRGREWTAFLPSLCNSLSIAVSTTTGETRYLLPTYMLAPCLLLYCVIQGVRREI